MAFTINDLADLKQLLVDHPEWRAELRPLILGEEISGLPEFVRRLAEAQERTEQRLNEVAAKLDRLVIAVDSLSQDIKQLVAVTTKQAIRIDRLDGAYTEWVFVRKAEAYFGTWLRRTRVVSVEELGIYDAEDRGDLTEDEVSRIQRLDMLVRGRDTTVADRPDTVFAVEVSSTVDYEDVDRARDRAALLGKAGLRARPAVAGHDISSGVQRFADEHSVFVKIVPQSELPR